MTTATVIGLVAGTLTTVAWLPQVLKAFRSHSTKDFAWEWFAMFGTGVSAWLIYGFLAAAPAVIAANALTLLFVIALGVLKAHHSLGSR